jgi:hypothetical protein
MQTTISKKRAEIQDKIEDLESQISDLEAEKGELEEELEGVELSAMYKCMAINCESASKCYLKCDLDADDSREIVNVGMDAGGIGCEMFTEYPDYMLTNLMRYEYSRLSNAIERVQHLLPNAQKLKDNMNKFFSNY